MSDGCNQLCRLSAVGTVRSPRNFHRLDCDLFRFTAAAFFGPGQIRRLPVWNLCPPLPGGPEFGFPGNVRENPGQAMALVVVIAAALGVASRHFIERLFRAAIVSPTPATLKDTASRRNHVSQPDPDARSCG